MEENRIAIFENFALTSVIMPYYGPTHKMFLMLSSFWVGSRKKLDEYYKEFIEIMKVYCLVVEINFDIRWYACLYVPTHLFILDILDINENIESFVDFIIEIDNKKGYYFNDHFMHDSVTIYRKRVLINQNLFEDLYPHVERLKKIKVLWDFQANENKFSNKETNCLIWNINFILYWIYNLFLKYIQLAWKF